MTGLRESKVTPISPTVQASCYAAEARDVTVVSDGLIYTAQLYVTVKKQFQCVDTHFSRLLKTAVYSSIVALSVLMGAQSQSVPL